MRGAGRDRPKSHSPTGARAARRRRAALIALVSNVIITLATLRHQRNRALQDRIWERRTDVYG
ncbi:hypothetical protein Psi02_70970 [Planotetraspora silvatica]|uniref:Uncharacterized protein n=1 Tax=Planotetraspora silvatica TaxID=234614 RepID=A0A8J3XVJ6_9ACTN|nr:hypothetical protein Psi02_70970 [Planotetraspora silvatica]